MNFSYTLINVSQKLTEVSVFNWIDSVGDFNEDQFSLKSTIGSNCILRS